MATRFSMQRRLLINRPSLRRNARPPKLRTARGADFTAANLGVALSLQQCQSCQTVNYPPREVCENCLGDQLAWSETACSGRLLQAIDLHHSLWEFYKRRLQEKPWPIASVKLDAGPAVFAHVAIHLFAVGIAAEIESNTQVSVFSHSDCSKQSVLIAVPNNTAIETASERHAIVEMIGLLNPAIPVSSPEERKK